jgi:hypothetical protein
MLSSGCDVDCPNSLGALYASAVSTVHSFQLFLCLRWTQWSKHTRTCRIGAVQPRRYLSQDASNQRSRKEEGRKKKIEEEKKEEGGARVGGEGE